ncbi:hypothetical protein PAMA_005001 [Pampus argenteus]
MEANTPEEQLFVYATEGSCSHIQRLLQLRIEQSSSLNINCRSRSKASLGWTPLHLACYFGHGDVVEELVKEIVLLLLRYDARANIINGTAQIPKDVTEDDEIITMLEAAERREARQREERLLDSAREGDISALSKLLSGQEAPDINCRDSAGNTPLHCAAYRGQKQCIIKLLKSGASLSIKNNNGQTALDLVRTDELKQILAVYQDKRWLDAFEAHSSYSTQQCTQQHIIDDDSSMAEGSLTQALQAASAYQLKLDREVSIFLSMVKNEKNNDSEGQSTAALDNRKRSSGLSHSSQARVALKGHSILGYRALGDWGVWFGLEETGSVWSLKLEQEVEKNKALTEALQTLANEHHELKQSLCKSGRLSTLSTLTEDDFYDAVSESESELSVSGFLSVASHSCEEDEGRETPLLSSLCHPSALRGPAGMSGEGNHDNQTAQHNGVKKHRNDVSIWSILKKCIGMELSKIAMPVIFNEPLSFLQRLTEYMEHTYLIHQANATTDSVERMKCVAAFAVSAVASQWERTGKPFNPLLGETYELIRWISEQVSHHPPVSAFHAEGLKEDFVFHGSIYPKLKFWGKSIEAEPKGIITLELPKYNEAYTWTNPTCCVHNIIVGQLWIEQYGSVEVINHKTGERCSMMFKSCGLFGKELHKVEGYILDKSKKKLCAIYGKWTECLYTVDPATFDAHKKTDRKNSEGKKGNKQFYAFSTFAMQLNELEKSMEGVIPPTDSRLRPDICAMENGDIDLASAEKKRLEEKQRIARKNRTKSTEEWKNRWFQQGPNPHNKAQDWIYLKGYWDRNYTQLPDIY